MMKKCRKLTAQTIDAKVCIGDHFFSISHHLSHLSFYQKTLLNMDFWSQRLSWRHKTHWLEINSVWMSSAILYNEASLLFDPRNNARSLPSIMTFHQADPGTCRHINQMQSQLTILSGWRTVTDRAITFLCLWSHWTPPPPPFIFNLSITCLRICYVRFRLFSSYLCIDTGRDCLPR